MDQGTSWAFRVVEKAWDVPMRSRLRDTGVNPSQQVTSDRHAGPNAPRAVDGALRVARILAVGIRKRPFNPGDAPSFEIALYPARSVDMLGLSSYFSAAPVLKTRVIAD